MSRSLASLTFLVFVGLTLTPIVAQESPGQGRGQGFRGGRGIGQGEGRGPGLGRGMRDRAEHGVEKNLSYPAIASHGGVFQLSDAAQQPRDGTKLLVDVTSGSDAGKVNSGLEKVAKYLNIYVGGGAKPAKVNIAVVLHGEATLIVLNPEAYSTKFQTEGNPNLDLMHALHEAGVDLYVCGQSLLSKGAESQDVVPFVKTAVSALTAVVNLQTDGYAYVPIGTSSTTEAPESKKLEENQSSGHMQRRGMGFGRGRGMGMGPGLNSAEGADAMQGDMETLHAMFADRDKIQRSVKNLPDGAEALTESDDDAIANLLKEHVPNMEGRVLGNDPLPPMTFHPIFVELIKHADDYSLSYEETDKGIKVRYQAKDPYVIMLVQEHAKLVSRFIKNGMEEIHVPYTLPKVAEGTSADDH